MNLLDRMKGMTRGKNEGSTATLDDVEDFGGVNPAEATIRLGPGTLPAHEGPATHADSDSSIISEAAPSELAPEYSETRMHGDVVQAEETARKTASYASLWIAASLLFGAIVAAAAAMSARWEDDKVTFGWPRSEPE